METRYVLILYVLHFANKPNRLTAVQERVTVDNR